MDTLYDHLQWWHGTDFAYKFIQYTKRGIIVPHTNKFALVVTTIYFQIGRIQFSLSIDGEFRPVKVGHHFYCPAVHGTVREVVNDFPEILKLERILRNLKAAATA